LKYADHLYDVSSLLGRPWISRSWTFQEITLASAPIIVCGVKSCPWSVFSEGLDFLFDGEPAFFNFLPMPMATKAVNMRIPLPNIDPWVDLIRFWGNMPRPTSWNGAKLRAAGDDETWTADKYQARYLHGALMDFVDLSTLVHLLGLVVMGGMAFAMLPVFVSIIVPMTDEPAKDNTRGMFIYSGLLASIMLLTAIWGIIGVSDIHMRSDLGTLNRSAQSSDHDSPAINKALLAQTIRVLQVREASNPKDKSFALYAVFKSIGILTPPPDYSKHSQQVYRDLFTSLLAKDTRCINLILLAGHSDAAFPSWIPNWDTTGEATWLNSRFVSGMLRYYPINWGPLVRIEQDELHVHCVWGGQVSFTTTKLPRVAIENEALGNGDVAEEECTLMSMLCQWLRHSPPNVNLASQSRNILVADGIEFGNRELASEDELLESHDEWFRTISEGLLTDFRIDEQASPSQSRIADFLRDNPTVRTFLSKVSSRMGEKRCLVYGPDAGLGTASVGAREGDKIATVMGLATPMILRETTPGSGTYTVIGPAIMERLLHWEWKRTRYVTIGGTLNQTIFSVPLKDHELELGIPELYNDLDRFEEVVLN
jgi:hypothetical protein